MEPKNICLISFNQDPFVDRMYWKFALSLNEQYNVSVFSVLDYNKEFVSEHGIKIRVFKKKNYSSFGVLNNVLRSLAPLENKKIVKACIDENASLYIINQYKLFAVAIELHKKGKKVLFDYRDPYYINLKEYSKDKSWVQKIKNRIEVVKVKKIEQKWLPKISGVITTEPNVAERCKSLGVKNIRIIYNYTNLNEERNNLKFEERPIDILYCGLLTKYRGSKIIPKVLKLVKESIPKVQFVHVGNVNEKYKMELLREVKEYDLEENVKLVSQQPYKEIGHYYSKSKIGLALLQDIETHHIILPIKIFEYSAYGNLIIGSNFGHVNHYITNYNLGYSFEPDSVEKIANRIIHLLKSKKEWNRVNINNIKQSEKFRWEKMKPQFIQFIEEIIEN